VRRVGLLVGLALVVAGAGGWLWAQGQVSLHPRGDAPVTAGAQDLTDIDAHNSPVIARNPVDPDNVVVANRIDTPRFGCGLHVSHDGGDTWRHTDVPIPAGEEPKCFAPDVAFGGDGTLYVAYTTLAGLGNHPNAAWLATSNDGGDSLSQPTRLLDELAFQVRLAADPTAKGRLYLTWLQAADTATLGFPQAGYPLRAMRSDDGGATWTEPVDVNPAARRRVVAPTPVVGRDGRVYVAYLDLGDDRLDYHAAHQGRGGPAYQGPWQLVVAASSDQGRSWRQSVVDDALAPIDRILAFLPDFPALAVDRDSGRLYAGFHDAGASPSDVWVWASDDHAASWSAPTRVSHGPAADATTQHLPQLDVAPTGRLDVVYYDRRRDGDDTFANVSLQSSVDGAATFTEPVALASEAFDSRIGFGSERGLPDLGSRLGLLAAGDRATAVWSDTRAGTQASNKQDLYRATVAVDHADGLALPAPAARHLPTAALAVAVVGLAVVGVELVAIRRDRG